MYHEDVLQGAVKQLNIPSSVVRNGSSSRTQFLPKSQDDSGVAARNVPAFISAEDWPSGSPDLNPWDYKLWVVLEDMACQKCHNNLNSLKRSLVKAVAEIPLETVHATIAEWPERLKVCVKAEGSNFEWHYYKYKLKTTANKLFGLKSGCSVSFSF